MPPPRFPQRQRNLNLGSNFFVFLSFAFELDFVRMLVWYCSTSSRIVLNYVRIHWGGRTAERVRAFSGLQKQRLP